MRKISKVEPTIPTLPTRLRVAAYARVSVEQERSIHSMSAQISYYNELIQKNPEWEFAGVYADLGISGTGINKRDEFKRLIDDCNAGKIDIILTKSISRFARNTVDLLETVRHLKDLAIEVRFERENISSMSGDGELMLSILASFAQEESISISENCKWGIRKRFETGEIGTANKHILGYRYDEKQRKLGEVAEFNPKAELPDVFEYVDLESVVGTEMIAHREETKKTAPSRAQRLAKTGDIFYQTVRPYQKNNYFFENTDGSYVFSTGYAQMRPHIEGYFLLSYLQTEQLVNAVLDRCTGTSYPAINSNDLAEMDIYLPVIKQEQQQIGTYFRHLDNLIALHQRKHI